MVGGGCLIWREGTCRARKEWWMKRMDGKGMSCWWLAELGSRIKRSEQHSNEIYWKRFCMPRAPTIKHPTLLIPPILRRIQPKTRPINKRKPPPPRPPILPITKIPHPPQRILTVRRIRMRRRRYIPREMHIPRALLRRVIAIGTDVETHLGQLVIGRLGRIGAVGVGGEGEGGEGEDVVDGRAADFGDGDGEGGLQRPGAAFVAVVGAG